MIVSQENLRYGVSRFSTSDDDGDICTKTNRPVRVDISSSGYAALTRAKTPHSSASSCSYVTTMMTAATKRVLFVTDFLSSKPLNASIASDFIIPSGHSQRRGRDQSYSDSGRFPNEQQLASDFASESSKQLSKSDGDYRRRSLSILAKMNILYGAFILTIIISIFTPSVRATKNWTVEELLTLRFPYQTSNDLYLDVCKAGGFMQDIALTHEEVAGLRAWNLSVHKMKNQTKHKVQTQLDRADVGSQPKNHRTETGRRQHNHQQQLHQHNWNRHRSGRRSSAGKRNSYELRTSHPDVVQQEGTRNRRAATARPERIWEYGVIPYEIQANFSGEHQALFRRAMNHWENYTCLSFVPRTPDDESYIVFTTAECGCCSFVGKRGDGPQAISIGKNCDKFGIVVHELGHVVGFWHEHTRPDREQFVDIFYKNIQQGQDYNFEKLKPTEVHSLAQAYDFASIMHYARDTFARAMYLDTILPKPDPITHERPEIGQRVRLSPGDIVQTNLLYRCPKCGETLLDAKGRLSSPEFDNRLEHASESSPVHCQWRISGPQGHRIHFNVTALSLPTSHSCQGDNYVEVRDGHFIHSPLIGRYCGLLAEPIVVISTGNRLWIEYKSAVPASPPRQPRGFSAAYEVTCGGEISGSSGVIENPSYPFEYLPDQNCVWLITVPDGYQVAIIFTMFQLEQHDECIYDYVEFLDGHSENSKVISRVCGYTVPTNIKSSGNKMRIRFASDSSVEKSGFQLRFIKEFDECRTPNHGCQHKCVNTLGSYRCECDIGYELHSDGRSCEDACGGYLKGDNGTLSSPNFPSLYPNKKRCVWEIKANPQYRITLNFTHFDLEGVNTNCEYDYLKVTSVDAKRNVAKVHGQYCGKVTPVFLLTSETSHLRIEFVTDSTVQKSGFAAVYFTDKDECDVDNGGCQQICRNLIGSYRCECESGFVLAADGHHCKEGGCKFQLSAASGQLVSPNYPDEYPNKKECIWHFVTMPGQRIQLEFGEFDVEHHQECAYDRVELYDGSNSSSTSLGRYCGPRSPDRLITSKNELYMVFRSDSSVQKRGFKAFYTSMCGGTLQADRSVGYIYSHGTYGGSNYENKMMCDWVILARDGLVVELRFKNFELEEEYHCDYDYVEVFDGEDETARKLGRYCGTRAPRTIVSSGPALRLQFRSDDTVSFKGFVAEYFVTDLIEGHVYTEPIGTTTRPPLEPVINEKVKNQFRHRH